MQYKIAWSNAQGTRCEEIISARDDKEAIDMYKDFRNNHPGFIDLRLWKSNLPWRPLLIAANER